MKQIKQIKLINDDWTGEVNNLRHACRGILLKDGKILLGYHANIDNYIIPGGGVEDNETLVECCEREMLEETGLVVKALDKYVEIEELFDDWRHFNHYFVCEYVEDTGKLNLTEAERKAGCTFVWKTIDEAKDIFGKYKDYHDTAIEIYGLYRREYNALKEYERINDING